MSRRSLVTDPDAEDASCASIDACPCGVESLVGARGKGEEISELDSGAVEEGVDTGGTEGDGMTVSDAHVAAVNIVPSIDQICKDKGLLRKLEKVKKRPIYSSRLHVNAALATLAALLTTL